MRSPDGAPVFSRGRKPTELGYFTLLSPKGAKVSNIWTKPVADN